MMTNMVITSYGKSDDFKFYYSSMINRNEVVASRIAKDFKF